MQNLFYLFFYLIWWLFLLSIFIYLIYRYKGYLHNIKVTYFYVLFTNLIFELIFLCVFSLSTTSVIEFSYLLFT